MDDSFRPLVFAQRDRRPGIAGFCLAAALLLSSPARAGVNTWTHSGLEGKAVGVLVVDPGDRLQVYAGNGYAGNLKGLWKSRDGGLNWADVSSGLPFAFVHALAADPKQPGTLYAVNRELDFQRSLLYKTTDGAATWSSLGRIGVTSLLVPAEDPPRVYAGADHEVLSSRDGGKSWKEAVLYSSGGIFDSLSIISLGVAQSDSSTIYAGSDMDYPHDSVFRSTDAGATWAARDGGLSQTQSVFSLAVDPRDASRVAAGTSEGIWLTTDGGASWSLTLKAYTRALAVDPANPATLYAGTDPAGVQVSLDGGAHWSALNEGLGNRSVLSLAIDATGRHLYAGTRSGVYAYDVATGPLDVSASPGGGTGFLAMPAANRFVLGSVDSSGGTLENRSYGPYDGWIPRALASSADGLARVLWRNGDGRWDVWLVGRDGVLGSFLFAADADLTPLDIAGGLGGETHVLARGPAGAAIWGVDALSVRTSTVALGSYPGWTAAAISDGADGLSWVLWNNDDGRSGISLVSSHGILATARYLSEPGWTSTDLAAGGDGMTRILRTQEDGRVGVWIADQAGAIVAHGPAYSGPAGLTARHLAAGPDGSTRVLFTDSSAAAVVWILSPEGVFQGSFPLN